MVLNSIFPIVYALFSVIIIIFVGWVLKETKLIPEETWQPIEKLTYFVLFPALIIKELATVNLSHIPFIDMAVALNVAQLIMFALSFLAWSFPSMNGPKFTSIVQNNIRWNSFVALGLVSSFIGEHALAIAAIAIAAMIPTSNIISVWSLLIWGKPENVKISPITGLFKNPLIIACAIGVAIQYYNIQLPDVFIQPLDLLGSAAMSLGLLAIGAGLDLEDFKDNRGDRLLWSVIRLLGFPFITFLCLRIFGVHDPDIYKVALIATSAPTATNSYILARQLGGDANFMATLVGTTTLFALVTIPFVFLIFDKLT